MWRRGKGCPVRRLWAAVCAVGLYAAGLCGCAPQTAAFFVDGTAVEKAELIHYMKENTAVVAAELEAEQGLDSAREDFWTAPQNGIDTFARLREYTVRQLVRQKTEQLCAGEQGVDTPLLYSQQLSMLQENNRQRASAHAAGEVLYGPVQRDFVAWFSEWYLDMRQQSRRGLIEKGILSVSPEETEAYYQAHPDYFAEETREDALYRIREHLLDEAYEDYIDARAAQAEVTEGNAEVSPNEVV